MLSQLTKTVKLALKSTEEERAILRARSALQRFPVVEWRQRTEDFHKRSITVSRNLSGANAWRESDCNSEGARPMVDTDDWDPVSQSYPSQPEWDNRSSMTSASLASPVALNSPGSPGRWSQDTLTPNAAPRLLQPDGYRSSYSTENGEVDYFSHSNASPEHNQSYGDFLEKANRVIGRDHRYAPDPFLDGGVTPSRPFGLHSRISSVESISSIVDEKSNSPLNKAIASVSFRLLLFCTYADVYLVHGFRWWCSSRLHSEITGSQRQKF